MKKMNTQEKILDLMIILKNDKQVVSEEFCRIHKIKKRTFKDYIRLLRFYQSKLFGEFQVIKYCSFTRAYILTKASTVNAAPCNAMRAFLKTQERVIRILLEFNEKGYICISDTLKLYSISSKTLKKIISNLRNVQFDFYDYHKIIVYKAKTKRYVLEKF